MDSLRKLTAPELAYLRARELNTLRSGIYAAMAVLVRSEEYRAKGSTGRAMVAAMWKEQRRIRCLSRPTPHGLE